MHIKKHEWTLQSFLWVFGISLCFCLAQVGYTWIFASKEQWSADRFYRIVVFPDWNTSPGSNFIATGYLRFNNWDSLRFDEIATHGYHIPNRPLEVDDVHHYRANITMPPAFPLLVRFMQKFIKIRKEYIIPMAAQCSCVVFWMYFILLLLESGLSRREAIFSSLTVAFHPAAFYMVVGYTESLLMASMMGFIYWVNRWMNQPKLKWGVLSCVHGFICTATRVPGIPVATYPFIQAFFKFRKRIFQAGLISFVAGMGLISFFIFCHIQFKEWDLYFKIRALLGQETKYLTIFNPLSYLPRYFFENTMLSINRSAVPWSVFLILIALKLDKNPKDHAGLYWVSSSLLYISMIAQESSGMDGMIRYTLPIFAIMVLCLSLVYQQKKERFRKIWCSNWKWIIIIGYFLGIATQGWMAWKYLHGTWVT